MHAHCALGNREAQTCAAAALAIARIFRAIERTKDLFERRRALVEPLAAWKEIEIPRAGALALAASQGDGHDGVSSPERDWAGISGLRYASSHT